MFKKNMISVGLDLGTSTIKLAKLKFTKEGVEIVDFFIAPVQPNVSAALKAVYEHQDSRQVNTSLCGSSTIIRYANFPKMQDVELKKSLKFEAQKFIPFSIAEINLDAAVLKRDMPDNKMLVLLAAVKKDYINQKIKLLEAGGFRLTGVELDSLALINTFTFNYLKNNNSPKVKTVALLNIGASYTNLNILEDGIPLLSRDLSIAGNNFTQKISDIFAIDLKAAEILKINPDKERLTQIMQAAESVLSGLATEIRVSFDYYESQNASSVSKIFLSGGGSLFPGLKDILANLLGIEVEYWDPMKQVAIAENVDAAKLKALAPQLAIAVGSALRV